MVALVEKVRLLLLVWTQLGFLLWP